MSTTSRRHFLAQSAGVLGAAAALTPLASRLAPRVAAQDLVKAMFQLGWIANVENAGEFVAADRGYYTAEGIDLTIEPGGPAVSVEPLVVSGKAIVGLSAADAVARARLNGGNLKVVATTFQSNPSAVMSLASAPITSPQELVGKKLGMQQSGVPIYDAFFTLNGIDPKDITYVPVQFDPAPLVTGEVDAFASFQTNQPIQLATQGVETTTFLLADFGFNLFADAVLASEDSLNDEEKRGTIVKILRATILGWQDALADPEAAAQLVIDTYGEALSLELEPQTLTMQAQVPLIKSAETDANGLMTMSEAAIKNNIDTLALTGVTITAEELFDTSLLAEIFAGGPVLATPVA